MQSIINPPVEFLDSYLEASRERYNACLNSVEHNQTIEGVDASVSFQYVRFDTNGQAKFKDLARTLAEHIVEYSLSLQARNEPTKPHEWTALAMRARDLFRGIENSGEAGEILLYFLLETVLGAPQMVAKMELKTNRKMELHGSDGIHMKWCDQEGILDLYFGEAKIYVDVKQAVSDAVASIERFHKEGCADHEYRMVTAHFKHASGPERDAISRYVDRGVPGGDCRINHACLIGFNWHQYSQFVGGGAAGITERFRELYAEDFERLASILKARLDKCVVKHLRFTVFFLPFGSVDEFRSAFLREVGAGE